MIKSFAAGFLISIGCKVSATQGGPVGALLFSIALLCIIRYKLPLFTGKVGYRTPWKTLLFVLLFNLIGAFAGGLLFQSGWDGITMYERCSVDWITVLCKAVGCGVLMYIAVDYGKRSPLITVMAIMTFILCGFEHCVADAAFLGDGIEHYPMFLPLVIAGNTIGGKLAHFMLGELDDGARTYSRTGTAVRSVFQASDSGDGKGADREKSPIEALSDLAFEDEGAKWVSAEPGTRNWRVRQGENK